MVGKQFGCCLCHLGSATRVKPVLGLYSGLEAGVSGCLVLGSAGCGGDSSHTDTAPCGPLFLQAVTAGMELKASNGKVLPALTVFSESLRYLKEHALNTIKEASFQTVYDHEEITWVITVPAIWSAAAKQFMRLAAKQVKAGVTPFPHITFGAFFAH